MIHVLCTGGTISMRHDPARGGNVPTDGGAELIALSGDAARIPHVVDDWARMPACHLDQRLLGALRERVLELAAGPVTGIVLTHGTDVLEETAYLLARTLPSGVPVVLTGAMRPADHPQGDGTRNLGDAMRVAADPAARGRGTMVVFAGRILDGLSAVKMHANDPDAFAAPHAAQVGAVAAAVSFSAAPPARRPVSLPAGLTRRVALLPATVGDDGALLDAARPMNDGVVIAAFGSGNIPPGMVPAMRRWIDAGKPVVLASRCAYGSVEAVYGFDGGGAQLIRDGAVLAGPRTPSQARMELLIALSAGIEYGAAA